MKNQDLKAVYEETRASLLRFAGRYFSKRPQEVEDVVQDAFVKMLEAKRQREIHSPKAYLFRTTRNLALNHLDRSDNRLTDTIVDLLPEHLIPKTLPLEQEFESRQRFEAFCSAVRQLPVKGQRAFILRRVYGFSQKEIAERMGIGVKAVEAHLTKSIVRCARLMEAIEADDAQSPRKEASK